MKYNTISEILEKTPKLNNNTFWEKLPNGNYYVKNLDFNISLMVSEYVINFLKLATGKSTIKQICEQASLSVNKNNINKIHELYYVTLYPIGVLEKEKIEIKKKKGYINLTFTILSEKKVVFLSRYLNFFFHKKVVFASLLFSLFSLIYSGVYYLWIEPSIELTNIDNPILIGILLIPIFFIHELGHSSALYHFGETPSKIGMGLYLLAPVLFADVTDSWKLNRKQRMIVDIGGLYFQFIASCFYLFIFLILNNIIFLYSALFSILVGAFNLNPFVKMDGYWLISDYLNIPNLKQKASTRSLSIIRSIFTSKKTSIKSEDIAFVLYYATNLLFTAAFIVYMLLWNIELFTELPGNVVKISLSILKCEYNTIDIISLESIFLPSIVVFLVLNMMIKVFTGKKKAHNNV